jgi:CRP-like cAMP-binding protein
MDRNLLVNLMPDAIREDLMGVGSHFESAVGEHISSDMLQGSHVFIILEGIGAKFLFSPGGKVSEIGMVGSEGMFPMSALLDVPAGPGIIVSQVGRMSGRVLRTKDFQAIIRESAEASALIRKYVFADLTQMASNLMASEQNSARVRIGRWLLMCHDRTRGDYLPITHDALAQMAFTHRPTVTNILHELRNEGMIEMQRGQVRILSRAGLNRVAEGSYGLSEKYWQDHIAQFGKGVADNRLAA